MDTVREKIENAFADMSAHSENEYTDKSEYSITFTVEELKLLCEELGIVIYY